MPGFEVLDEDGGLMQEAVKKEAGFVPKSILRSVRFGRNKSKYDREKKTRARAFSYARVSFSAIPMIHEYVVLTKSEIKRAKIKAENDKRREERKKEKDEELEQEPADHAVNELGRAPAPAPTPIASTLLAMVFRLINSK